MKIYGIIDEKQNVIFCGTDENEAHEYFEKFLFADKTRDLIETECDFEAESEKDLIRKITDVYEAVRNGALIRISGAALKRLT